MITRPRLRAALVLASAAALSACGAPADKDPSHQLGSGVVQHSGDLSAYLVPAPADATDVNGGPITLAEDAAGSGNPQARTRTLQTYGFKAEVDRGWKASDGSEIEVVLIQFSTLENATIYVKDVTVPTS